MSGFPLPIDISSICPDGKLATSWMSERIFIFDVGDLLGSQETQDLQKAVCGLPFIYDHVGGLGTNSPQRGVCVIGNRLLDETSDPIEYTHWTASQNSSHITLTTETVPLPYEVIKIIQPLVELTKENFPEAPISSSTYCLGVVNEYRKNYKDNISPHTDAQPWYANPPVFASITYYPDGQPKVPDACFRFKILDESVNEWRFVHLPHNSLCLMRADVTHQVSAPLEKYKSMFRRRINITLRNLVPCQSNPLGFAMALANHYRYYGKPISLTIPQETDVAKHDDLIRRYCRLARQVETAEEFKIIRSGFTSTERKKLHSQYRQILKHIYSENQLDDSDITNILSKSNVVIETTHRAIGWARKDETPNFDDPNQSIIPIENVIGLPTDFDANINSLKSFDITIDDDSKGSEGSESLGGNNNILKDSNKLVNPVTNRKIIVGGPTYKKLLKDGYIIENGKLIKP